VLEACALRSASGAPVCCVWTAICRPFMESQKQKPKSISDFSCHG